MAGLEPNTALQLVVLDAATGKYEIGAEAAKLLGALGSPTAAVSIAGALREGKSFILNKLASTAGGFPVSAATKPCTHGIWMRTKDVETDGNKRTVVFLDTEGTALYEQTAQSSATIVSLAGLVSSLLIYNKRGVFDENCVEGLFAAATIMDKLYEADGDEQGTPALEPPSLMVLLRDFYLVSEDPPNESLEGILAVKPLKGGDLKGIKSQNMQRDTIKSVFPKRSCHVLPHPGCDTTIAETLSDSQMSARFVEGVNELARAVYAKATPKLVQGKPMTGPVMLQLLEAAVEAINTGKVMNLPTVWGSMLERELQAAALAARQAYSSTAAGMETAVTFEDAQKLHKAALKAAVDTHKAKLTLSSTEESSAACQGVLRQLEESFALVSERIKRRDAEAALQYTQAVEAAKVAAVKAFDEERLLAPVLDKQFIMDADSITEQYQVHYDKATNAFVTAMSKLNTTMKDSPAPAAKTKVSSAAKVDLQTFMQRVHDALQQHMKARLAAQQAQQAAAQKKKVEEEHRQEKLMLLAKDAATARYKRCMEGCVEDSQSLRHLESAHKDILAKVVRKYPVHASDSQVKHFSRAVTVACNELHALNVQVVRQRIQQVDKAQLGKAERQAIAVYEARMSDLGPDCTDCEKFKNIFKAARTIAANHFYALASEQRSFGVDSKEYIASCDSLRVELATRADQGLAVVMAARKREEAAAAALRKQQEEAAAARQEMERQRRALEAAAEEARRAEQRRRQEQEEALERERERQRERVRELEREAARERERQQQMYIVYQRPQHDDCYQVSYYSRPCSGYSSRSYDDDDDGCSYSRASSSRSSGRCQAITTRGTRCTLPAGPGGYCLRYHS